MAQGSVTVFDEALPNLNFGAATTDAAAINVDADSFKIMITTTAIGSIPASTATPQYSDWSGTEATNGGGYTTTGAAATITVSEAGGTLTVALGADVVWTSTGSGGETNMRSAILYSDTSTNDLALAVIDLTEDAGTTPIDLNNGDLTISAGTLFTIA